MSVDQFLMSVNRLQESMINIVDLAGRKMLSVANPSVNDFLRAYLDNNVTEKKNIIHSCSSAYQLKRLLNEEEFEKEILRRFSDKSVLDFVYENENQKKDFIAGYCIKNGVMDQTYKPYVVQYMLAPKDIDFMGNKIHRFSLYSKLFDEDFCSFYELKSYVFDMEKLQEILMGLEDFDDAIEFVNALEELFVGSSREAFRDIVKNVLKYFVTMYCEEVPAENYDINVAEIANDYEVTYEGGRDVDVEGASDEINQIVTELVLEEISDSNARLPEDLRIDEDLSNLEVSVINASDMVESYYRDAYVDYDYDELMGGYQDTSEIENIFER